MGAARSKAPSTQPQPQLPADETNPVWRILRRLAPANLDTSSSLAGFLLGFLLVLLLLICCCCSLYCCLFVLRRREAGGGHLLGRLFAPPSGHLSSKRRPRTPASPTEGQASSGGGGLLSAERQNEENAARLRLLRAHRPGAGGPRKPTQPQSILKKQSAPAGGAPLARFETLKETAGLEVALSIEDEEGAGPQRVPAVPPRRGALASSLTRATGRSRRQAQLPPMGALRPTPARRRSRQLNDSDVPASEPLPAAASDSLQARQPQPQLAAGGQAQAPTDSKAVGGAQLRAPPGELTFSTRATRVEQSTSSRQLESSAGPLGVQRVTQYLYSEDTASYTESYLVSRGSRRQPEPELSGQRSSAAPPGAAESSQANRDYVNLNYVEPAAQAGGQRQQGSAGNQEEKQGRQSSLI